MKKAVMTSVLVLACMAGVMVVSAAAPTSFSGTWVLDKAKSGSVPRNMENADSVTWTINQDASQITIDTAIVPAPQFTMPAATYKLDGSETTAEGGGRFPGKSTLKAKWLEDGKALELTRVTKGNNNGEEITITSVQRLSLDQEGKVLKVDSKMEGPWGSRESNLVFTRK